MKPEELIDTPISENKRQSVISLEKITRRVFNLSGFLMAIGIIWNLMHYPFNGIIMASGVGLLINCAIICFFKKIKGPVNNYLLIIICTTILAFCFYRFQHEYYLLFTLLVVGISIVGYLTFLFVLNKRSSG